MKNWFNRLLALLARRGRTQPPRRVGWRGRPLPESTDGAIPQAGPYATLCLPPPGESARQSSREQPAPMKG
jgi:hypothetical protein